MKKIPLSKGQFAIVDDEDYEKLVQWKWHQSVSGYAIRNDSIINGIQPKVYMHRLILNVPNGFQGDHINRNKLDNRRKNLRICTKAENRYNKGPIQRKTASIYKGVYWHRPARKWYGHIQHNNKVTHLGMFKTEKEAAIAYNKRALKLFGQFARLNVL